MHCVRNFVKRLRVLLLKKAEREAAAPRRRPEASGKTVLFRKTTGRRV